LDHKRSSGKVFNFGNIVHYPVGSRLLDQGTAPDVVYRRVPVYTPEVRRSLSVAVTTQANIRKEKAMADIGASVPKNPMVRELYVDAVSGRPIGKWFNLYIFFFCSFKNINGFYFFFS